MKTVQLTNSEYEWIQALVKNYIEELEENIENPLRFVNGKGLEERIQKRQKEDLEELSLLLKKFE